MNVVRQNEKCIQTHERPVVKEYSPINSDNNNDSNNTIIQIKKKKKLN